MVDKPLNNKAMPKVPVASPAVAKAEVSKPVVPAAMKARTPQPVVAAPAKAPKPFVPTPAAKVDQPVIMTEMPAPVEAMPMAETAVMTPASAAPAPTPTKTPEPIVARIIEEGKTKMEDTMTKVQDTAHQFTADATARAGEMFGDVSARAKTAMEKGSKGLE